MRHKKISPGLLLAAAATATAVATARAVQVGGDWETIADCEAGCEARL